VYLKLVKLITGRKENGGDYKNTPTNHLKGVPSNRWDWWTLHASSGAKRKWFALLRSPFNRYHRLEGINIFHLTVSCLMLFLINKFSYL